MDQEENVDPDFAHNDNHGPDDWTQFDLANKRFPTRKPDYPDDYQLMSLIQKQAKLEELSRFEEDQEQNLFGGDEFGTGERAKTWAKNHGDQHMVVSYAQHQENGEWRKRREDLLEPVDDRPVDDRLFQNKRYGTAKRPPKLQNVIGLSQNIEWSERKAPHKYQTS